MPKLKEGLVSTSENDGAAILDSETGVISTLNSTGAYIWTGLSQGLSLDEISIGLARETGEPQMRVHHDVTRFVDQLRAEGLLQ